MATLTAEPSIASGRRSGRRQRARSGGLLSTQVTFAGLLVMGILVLLALAALNGEANLLLLLFGLCTGAVFFSALAPGRMVRRIDVERAVPDAVVAGCPFTITYIVRSHRRWLRAWGLLISEMPGGTGAPRLPTGFVPVLDSGATQRVELTGNVPMRGTITLPGIRITSRFPFGLFSASRDLLKPAELTVYPAVGRCRQDPLKDVHYAGAAAARVARDRGEQDEFFGLREYRQGDNTRWIHWKRSARTGELVVREMQSVRQTVLMVMVDAWPGDRPASPPRSHPGAASIEAERTISAAATAICYGLERGHRVGLICRAAVPVVIGPAGGRPHRQRLLRELAMIEPGEVEPIDALVSRVRWAANWHARCLLCATTIDPAHERVVRMLGGRTEGTLLISPETKLFDAMFDLTGMPAAARRTR